MDKMAAMQYLVSKFSMDKISPETLEKNQNNTTGTQTHRHT